MTLPLPPKKLQSRSRRGKRTQMSRNEKKKNLQRVLVHSSTDLYSTSDESFNKGLAVLGFLCASRKVKQYKRNLLLQ